MLVPVDIVYLVNALRTGMSQWNLLGFFLFRSWFLALSCMFDDFLLANVNGTHVYLKSNLLIIVSLYFTFLIFYPMSDVRCPSSKPSHSWTQFSLKEEIDKTNFHFADLAYPVRYWYRTMKASPEVHSSSEVGLDWLRIGVSNFTYIELGEGRSHCTIIQIV